jgi:putative endonuclease
MKTTNRWLHFLFLFYEWWDRRKRRLNEKLGPWGERWAARFLKCHGCRILATNIHPVRHGELDIIARKGKLTLFVEVKTRKNEDIGRPLEAITLRKRKHLRRCATAWLSQQKLLGTNHLYRFDAIEVIGTPRQGIPIIRWIPSIDMEQTKQPDI